MSDTSGLSDTAAFPESTADRRPVVPRTVREAPATAIAVYVILATAGPMTYDALALETGQSRRAVERAVTELRERDVVRSRPDATEPCRKLHETAATPPGP